MNLPNFLIIGAMKTGTTSLHHYLGLHPEIFMSGKKELDFFVEDLNWRRGLEWYRSQFPEAAKIRGEASPRYSLFPVHPGVPRRIHETIPDAKLLYLVRDPVERLISHYMHDVIEGSEHRALEEILAQDPENHYLLGSRYWLQIEQYRRFFEDSQILVVRQEDLRDRRLATLQSIFRFLDVAPEFRSWQLDIQRHQTRRKRRLSPLGQRLRGGALAKWLTVAPSSVRGYLQWLALYPFSEPVERYRPGEDLRSRLAALLAEESRQVFETMNVAAPASDG